MAIARVWLRQGMRVFDRTEVLFGSGRDFGDVRDQAARIGTIDAADFLDCVQIGQAVENQVISPPDLGDSIDREANGAPSGFPASRVSSEKDIAWGPWTDAWFLME